MLTVAVAVQWCLERWRWLALAGCVLFYALTVRGCTENSALQAKLEACEKKPPVVQLQTVTVTAKARQEVRIVYRDGSPCPDIASVNESEAVAYVSQSQTAQPSSTGRTLGPWSFSVGAAGYRGGLYGSLGGGYWMPSRIGDVGIEAAFLFPWAWEESQITRRPAGTLSLTVRP